MLTLSQLFTRVQIEFMPVYIPNDQEKKDPILFANTVRINMANALGVPVTDHTYADGRLMITAGNLQLPMETGLVEFTKISQKLKLDCGITFTTVWMNMLQLHLLQKEGR